MGTKKVIGDLTISGKLTTGDNVAVLTKSDIDATLSTTSENPVQNKVVTAAINSLQDDIDDVDAKANTVVIGGTQYTATFVDGVLSFTAV